MKLELDFEQKTITVKGNFKFSDLEKQVKKLGLEDWTIAQGFEFYTTPQIYPTTPKQDDLPWSPQAWYTNTATNT